MRRRDHENAFSECRDVVGVARVSVECQFLAALRGIPLEERMAQMTHEKACHYWATAIRVFRTADAPEEYIYVAESEICGIECGIIGVAELSREEPQ